MDEKYFAQKIERKWQQRWAERRTFEAEIVDDKEKFYCLEMLPYPSGILHMGHVRNYSIGDVLSWYKRLQGFNVLHPIGWDSFGQPAEQAAIKKGVNPRDWTEENIKIMTEQLKSLGLSYDWSREIAAHRPEYYKFDQWFFLKMLEMGLAYRKDSEVNWCPKCETTLSNEQASGGVCWRCGTQVEKQTRPQWFLRITKYADELLNDMSGIEDGWAERVLTMQRNWINKSVGANIKFQIANFKYRSEELAEEKVSFIEVFTTRIDTIYGVNALVVSPDHPFILEEFGVFPDEVKSKIEAIRVEQAKPKDYDDEIIKDGIDTGMKAVNPFSGGEIPVWVGNYVMMSYGTGAVMSVPGHDERDFEFARKFDLPIKQVIEPQSHRNGEEEVQPQINTDKNGLEKDSDKSQITEAFTEKGVLMNSGDWSGKLSQRAIREMTKFAESEGFGEGSTTYRLRDWGISRQRFWGSPIPIIYCDACGAVPVKFENLPVELPESAPFTGVGESPLAKVPEFVNTNCPKCGEKAKRETDTMDTFVDSSWYYFRYCDPHNSEMPFDSEIINYWMPVDQYIGGIDHAVMHLLYTRFWTKVCNELGLVDFVEPAKRLLTQGMVVTESFYSNKNESYVAAEDVKIERDKSGKVTGAKLKFDGSDVKIAVEKMGKSKLNGIDPNDMISIYGADSVRIFSMFAAPVENELVWLETGIEGAVRFIQRVWRYVFKWTTENEKWKMPESDSEIGFSADAKKLRQKTHQTISRITENFESGQFNTPVAALMELSNAMYDFKVEPETANDGDLFAVREACECLILMLTPYAPHVAEELWEAVSGSDAGILESNAKFPIADAEVAKETEVEIVVQVNGKVRSRVEVSADISKDELEQTALADERIIEYIDGRNIVKVIVVPGRLVNIVVR